jgi:hypothetical protein
MDVTMINTKKWWKEATPTDNEVFRPLENKHASFFWKYGQIKNLI